MKVIGHLPEVIVQSEADINQLPTFIDQFSKVIDQLDRVIVILGPLA
ncbi:hypothetical protein [Sporosarcina sp. FSL K6-3457]